VSSHVEVLDRVGAREGDRSVLRWDGGVGLATSTGEAGEVARAATLWREGANRDPLRGGYEQCIAREKHLRHTEAGREMTTKLGRIAERARRDPKTQFTSLAHLITVEALKEAWRSLKKRRSAGIDGVTAQEYERNLEENLQDLHRRLVSMKYRAQPVKRVYVSKGDGTWRPIGIPAVEDKIVQAAVRRVLEAIYEQDFYEFSYGFRPGRSAHQALGVLDEAIFRGKVNYVLDADISAFFDSMDRTVLMELLRRRIKDRSILRLIAKWLHAGVLEDGVRLYPETGSPQGAVISPLLANAYLHYVLDEWVEEVVRPRMRGEMYLVRYADDAIFCFQYRDDAERVVQALEGRLATFGLRLNPEKTRLIEFGRFAEEQARRRGRRPETFDFLGFTHICGRSRNGKFTVKRKTAAKRLRRSMRRVTEWCRDHRHLPVGEQHKILCAKLRGHCNYYGLTGNMRSLRKMWWHVVRTWRKWLNRRSQRGRMPWKRFAEVLASYPLPRPTVVHCGYKGAVFA
jgi:RNA-directed DNA polymerase